MPVTRDWQCFKSRDQAMFRLTIFKIACLSILYCFFLPTLQAQTLELVIQDEKNSGFLAKASGLKIMDSGRVLVTSSRDGTLLVQEKDAFRAIPLSPGIFKKKNLAGIDQLPDGSLVFANPDSGQLAITNESADRALRLFSQSGDDAGQLDEPAAVAVSVNQYIYIADRDNNRISVFNDQGLFLQHFGFHDLDNSDLYKPTHLALDAQGNIYVLEAGQRNRVSIFRRDGELIKQLDTLSLAKQLGGEIDFSAMTADLNGLLYLAEDNKKQVLIYNWRDDALISKFGSLGQSRGQYRNIAFLSVNNKGQLAVVDKKNRKVEVYQLENTDFAKPVKYDVIRFTWQQPSQCQSVHAFVKDQLLCVQKDDKGIVILSAEGKPQGEFASEIKAPTAIHSGSQMVAILQKNMLYTYTHDGQQIYAIGRYGISEGAFDKPSHVFTAHNQVYVADSGNNRVQIFARDGQFVRQIKGGSTETFEQVGPIAVDSQKNLYVADQAGKFPIRVLQPSHKSVISIGYKNKSIHQFDKIHALDIDLQDRLYVLGSSDANKYSVRLYENHRKIEEFGSGHNNGSPLYFARATSLSVSSSDKNTIYINDDKRNRLFRFDYHESPDAAFGLRVQANKEQVKLHWASSYSPLIAAYQVQAAASADGLYRTIAKTTEPHITFKYIESQSLPWYRIRTISGLGVTGAPSAPRQNRFYQLDQLFKLGQYHEVIKLADRILKAEPDNADVLYHKAQSQLLSGQQQASLASFRRLEQFPGYQDLSIRQQVRAFYELEQYLDARSLIEQVLAQTPDELYPYLVCAELSIKLADAIGAVTCAEDGLARHADSARLRYLLGRAYIMADVIEQGLQEYATVVASYPDNYPIRLLIAEHYMQMQRYQLALDQYEAIAKVSPEPGAAVIGQANALLMLDRDDEAKTIAINLSTQESTKGDGYYVLGKIATKQQKYTEAVLRLTRACKVKPENIDAWYSLAQAYIKLNKKAQAFTSLGEGVKTNKDSFRLNHLAGQLALQLELYDQAIGYLDKAAELRPQDVEVNKLYTQGLIATRNFHSALQYAQRAARLAPKDIEVLTLQAEIANQQGKISSAIEYLKTAINLQPASAQLQYKLGKVYLDANLFDQSQQHLEKAAGINPAWAEPHLALGQMFSKRRLFDQAITALEKAVKLDPSDNNRALLNSAFADKKRSLEFKSNAPQLLLTDLNLKHVFSAAYKKYANQSIGSVNLKNAGGTDYGNLQLSFQIKEYMDFPVIQDIALIKGNETLAFDFKVTFNNKILEVDEDIGVQVEVKLSYNRDGQKDFIRLTQPMTIYGKNAMLWGDAQMVGSFVTPKDDSLRNYVRTVINEYQPHSGPLNDKLVAAMTYFSSLTAAGTKYVIDPNTPYTTLREDQVDYVQFPRETLKLKSGDCDDLSVLLSAGLENLGIETALLEVPGHLLLMFNTGLPENEANLISQDSGLIAIRNGQVWIPLEATMINASFNEAWAEGARRYHQAKTDGNLGIIDLQQAWQQYPPVTLKKARYSINIPDPETTGLLISTATNQLLAKSINRLILPFQSMIENNPKNIEARMQIAILYSRYGLYHEAQLSFDELYEIAPQNSAVHTNQGNLYLLQDDYDKAIASYLQAVKLDEQDGGIWLNLSMARYKKGDLNAAARDFQTAISKSPDLKNRYAAYSKLLSQ